MCDRRRCGSAPNEDESMSISPAAAEAFEMLNAATRMEYRGWGDTQTAARDRAARKAGVSPAQAERVWKHWKTMKTPNGDVYRAFRNTYGHLCTWIENKADALERRADAIEANHAASKSHAATVAGRTTNIQSEKE